MSGWPLRQGYETREESRMPWEHLPPANNKQLMIAIAEVVLQYVESKQQACGIREEVEQEIKLWRGKW